MALSPGNLSLESPSSNDFPCSFAFLVKVRAFGSSALWSLLQDDEQQLSSQAQLPATEVKFTELRENRALPTPDSSYDSIDDAFCPRRCTTSCPPGSAYGSAANTCTVAVGNPAQTNFHNWFDDVCDLVFGDEAALNQLVKTEASMNVRANDEEKFQAQWAKQGWDDLQVSLDAARLMVAQKAAMERSAQSAPVVNLNTGGMLGMETMVDTIKGIQATRAQIVQQLLCNAYG